jgi:heme-degrading monooxygenase HmoA
MYAVIFQVEPKPGRAQEYLDIAGLLRAELEKVDGFISVERFESVSTPGKYVSLSFWRDEAAILEWRSHVGHQHAQRRGRGDIFRDYRLSVVHVVRDYGMFDRDEAPQPVAAAWGEDFPF